MDGTHKQHDLFVTTRWSAVLEAGSSDTTRARSALAELCQAYWYPLYAYIRRRGRNPHDAEDLTQGFFARLLRLNSFAGLSAEKGKFRAFLLASLNHFLAEEWDHSRAQKRDFQRTISLDAMAAENRYHLEPTSSAPPECLFEREWALTLLETVVTRLSNEYEASGRGALFMGLRFAITGDKNSLPYGELAVNLSMREEAVRVAVHRLRQRYRRILRDEIAQTVAHDSEIAGELIELRRILS